MALSFIKQSHNYKNHRLTHVDVHSVNVDNFISKEGNNVRVTEGVLPRFLITAVQLRRTDQVPCTWNSLFNLTSVRSSYPLDCLIFINCTKQFSKTAIEK